jgi:uncharacterized protein YvpB
MANIGRQRYRHYVVLVGMDREHIYIRDPYPKGRPPSVLIKDFLVNGNPMSWGNSRWALEVYWKDKLVRK